MELEQLIEQSEEKWLDPSYQFIKSKFETKPLPSHDHTHHLRVWKYAKQLLLELVRAGKTINGEFVESLLLASLFHDSGMIEEQGSSHGKISSKIFREFLKTQNQDPLETERITEVIEKHDDKTFRLAGRLINGDSVSLLPALHISDDLDAFGNIGVYRYSEIYLLRGVPMEDLGLKIIANLSGRYGNFMSNCSRLPEMIRIHSMRYHKTESFFRQYNLQIRKTQEAESILNGGPVGVIKNIYRQVLMNIPSIKELSENIKKSSEDAYIHRFLNELENELQA